jgi:CBS domain containing-hemolysin-like protein
MLKKDEVKSAFSRKDFLAMADIGAEQGVFEPHESDIIANLLRFQQVRIEDVMTPRTVVKSAPAEMTIGQFFESHRDLQFSRVPLYLRRDLLTIEWRAPIVDALNRFLQTREHIALVVDSFGGVAGVVTMEDVIETLLGVEIVDESEQTEDLQALARQNWERRARRMGLSVEPAPGEDQSP